MPYRKALAHLFERLWSRYRREVWHAQRYVELVEAAGGRAVNDHIALRSLNLDLPMQPAGIQASRLIFETLGYRERGQYEFPDSHLTAIHMEHDELDLPRLFISQLEVTMLPTVIGDLIRNAVSRADQHWVYPEDVIRTIRSGRLSEDQAIRTGALLASFFSRPWSPPRRAIIAPVNEVSQYASWTLLHGNAVNHFTASINDQGVPGWDDIGATVAALKEAGVPMKDTIEGQPGSRLRQTSTQAVRGEFDVTEENGDTGTMPWTYAYYELAERGFVTHDDGSKSLFTGFLTSQTPGLFDMTRMR